MILVGHGNLANKFLVWLPLQFPVILSASLEPITFRSVDASSITTGPYRSLNALKKTLPSFNWKDKLIPRFFNALRINSKQGCFLERFDESLEESMMEGSADLNKKS